MNLRQMTDAVHAHDAPTLNNVKCRRRGLEFRQLCLDANADVLSPTLFTVHIPQHIDAVPTQRTRVCPSPISDMNRVMSRVCRPCSRRQSARWSRWRCTYLAHTVLVRISFRRWSNQLTSLSGRPAWARTVEIMGTTKISLQRAIQRVLKSLQSYLNVTR